jgi:hypothetical protein
VVVGISPHLPLLLPATQQFRRLLIADQKTLVLLFLHLVLEDMFPQLVALTAFAAEEVDLVVIASAVQILLRGELHHQTGLPQKLLREVSLSRVAQPRRRRRQYHLVQRQPFPQAHPEAFQLAHEQEFLLAHLFNILPAFTILVRMLQCPLIQAHVLTPQWPIFRK